MRPWRNTLRHLWQEMGYTILADAVMVHMVLVWTKLVVTNALNDFHKTCTTKWQRFHYNHLWLHVSFQDHFTNTLLIILAVFIKSKKMQYIVDFMGWSLHWRDKTAICAIYRDKWCTNYLKIAYAFLCNCHKTICITKTQRTYKLFSKKYCSIFYRWTLDFPFPFMFNLCTLTGQALNFMFSYASAALNIQCLTQSASSGYGEPKHLWV